MKLRRALLLVALMGTVTTSALLVPVVAEASEAEKLRLEEEMYRLAERNAWAGVERKYEELMALKGVDIPFDDHFLGAQSARKMGKTWQVYERLQRALQLDTENVEIKDELAAIDRNFGRIDIQGDPRRRPVLSRANMPFAPDQRQSIEYAIEVVAGSGSFYGMLPAGDYTVGYDSFTVVAGQDFQVVEVSKKKPKTPKGEKPPEGEEPVVTGPDPAGFQEADGVVIYAGPFASVGAGLGISPQPSSSAGGSLLHPQPDQLLASGIVVMAGGEIGFNREFAVLAAAGYQGVYGNDTYHQVTGWLGAAIRPGDLRIAIGPTYNFLHQTGTGIAPFLTYDDGTLVDSEHLRLAEYSGNAWGPGARLTVGYGVLRITEKYQGSVEIGAQWMGGPRNYIGIDLRVGIVPRVPRFEG